MPKGISGRAICKVDGCDHVAHGAGYCDPHYSRWRRHGDPLAGLVWGAARSVTAQGYVVLARPSHPLASPKGKVLEHRMVLFDTIGLGAHPCHWCGRTVRWDAGRGHRDELTTDHLDSRRDNNDPSNLVPSCLACNSGRSRRKPAALGADQRGVQRDAR